MCAGISYFVNAEPGFVKVEGPVNVTFRAGFSAALAVEARRLALSAFRVSVVVVLPIPIIAVLYTKLPFDDHF